MKRATLIFFSFMLVAFSFGCSSQNNSSNESGGKDVTLTFMLWGNEAHQSMYQGLIDKFEEQNPNIKVKMESVPFPDYQQKITVLAAGNELADIGWVAERMVPQFMKNNILADVSSFKEDDTYNMDDFFSSTLDLFRDGDKLYGIPFSTPPMVLFYNKTLFEENGEKTPNQHVEDGNWTWEQFEKSSSAVAAGTGAERVYGANFFRDWNTWIALLSHTWSYGGSLFNEDMTKFTWNSPEGVESIKMLQRMMFDDQSHPKAGEQVDFTSGKVGMFYDVYSYVSRARDIQDFEWDIAPLPKGPEGRFPMLGQAGISMFAGSDYPDETMKLLKFLTNEDAIKASSAFFVPPRKSVLSSDDFMNRPNNPPVESIERAVIDEMDNARLQAGHTNWQKIDSAIQFGFDELFGQIKSPEDILKEMEQKINPLLKE